MLAVADAHARIVAACDPLPLEWVPLGAADGRVLARDLSAGRDQPPRAISAMDGYAVRAADLAAGRACLALVGQAPAGGVTETGVAPGETVRIFTGGALPPGADAVVIQENASPAGDQVELSGVVRPGDHVRPAGLDFRRGEVGLAAGRRLTARDLGLAAALDHPWLPVRRQPRIGVLATGDELTRPGQLRGDHQIVNSNSVTLAAMAGRWGAVAVDLGIARDEPEALADLPERAAGLDLVVTLGGASVGDRDLVRQVLGEHGLTLDFWRIAMRPGKPLLFGDLAGTPLLGLPGNPVSAGVCAILFMRSAIAALLGLDPAPPQIPAVLASPLGANDQRQEYLRARTRWRDDGRLAADPARRQDSSMLATFARAEGLIVRAPFAPAMAVGTAVQMIPLDPAPIGV